MSKSNEQQPIAAARAQKQELALCRIASGRPNAVRWAVEIAREALEDEPR